MCPIHVLTAANLYMCLNKDQNHVADHETLVEKLNPDCGSLRNVVIIAGVHWQSFWELFQPSAQKQHAATLRSKIKRVKVCRFYERPDDTYSVASSKHYKKKFFITHWKNLMKCTVNSTLKIGRYQCM